MIKIIKDSFKIVLKFEELIGILYKKEKKSIYPIYYCEDAKSNAIFDEWNNSSVK